MAERPRSDVFAQLRKLAQDRILILDGAMGTQIQDLGLSEDRPLVILSGNSVAHALMAVGAHYVGIPSAAIAPAYALVSEGFEKLKGVRDQITPGAVFCEDTGPFK